MKTVLVAYDIDINEHVFAFVEHFARLLHSAGDEVTILTAGSDHCQIDNLQRANYQSQNIDVIHVCMPVAPVAAWPYTQDMYLSEEIAAHISLADVVYFSNRSNPAFYTIRRKRFASHRTPICVTVLHDSPVRQRGYRKESLSGLGPFISGYADRYSIGHSDFVVSLSQSILDQVITEAWKLPPPEHVSVLGFPYKPSPRPVGTSESAANLGWLAFHEKVCRYAQQKLIDVQSAPPGHFTPQSKAVDICVAYFNHPKTISQLLRSLEAQTCQDFNVIVIDDGSTDAEATAVFEQMRVQYAPRGWTFIHQENAYPGAARNRAVKCGSAEYLIFMDTDDVAAPTMVERFLAAIQTSGDDCITCTYYFFAGDSLPIDLDTGQVTTPAFYHFTPLGDDLIAGMIDGIYGGVVMIIRRTAFETVGGFTEQRGVGYEDWELYIRLLLAGYSVDVLPEYLVFVRAVEGSIMRSTDEFSNFRRGLSVYETRLLPAGLAELPAAIHGLYDQMRGLERQRDALLTQVQQRRRTL